MTHLQLGPGFEVPADVVTQTLSILAVRRAGKSNAAVVLAEEMFAAALPWVAIDPKGDWWGMRSSKDGKGPGLPIPIFGGLHGDVPLLPESGALMAELIVEQNLTCILDVSEFGSKAGQMRFLTEFAERIFRLHGRAPQARHMILEEADDFVPQRVMGEQARCVGAWTKLVKQGGSRGLGCTIVSQRSAVVNKDALTQTETMIALRTTSPQDRKAIEGWVLHHAIGREIVDSLTDLQNGEAWVISPHWLGSVERRQFRQRTTFDSGATPEPGVERRVATLADIDVDAIGVRMAGVIEKVGADDPKRLRKRIAELERELTRIRTERVEPERVEVEVLVPAFPKELVGTLLKLREGAAALVAIAEEFGTAVQAIADEQPPSQMRPSLRPASQAAAPPAVSRPAARPAPPTSAGERVLAKGERAIMTVLAQHPNGRTMRQLTTQTGYRASGGFRNHLSALRTSGYITGSNGGTMSATEAGLAALGDWDELPLGDALLRHWLDQLDKASALVLSHLVEVYPERVVGPALAAACGYEFSGGFRNALSKLRTLALIEGTNSGGMTVAEHFMEAIS